MSNGYLLAASADAASAEQIAPGFGLDVIDAGTVGDADTVSAALASAANVGLLLSSAAAADAGFVALLQAVAQRLQRAQLILLDDSARDAFAFLPADWPAMSFADAAARSGALLRQREPAPDEPAPQSETAPEAAPPASEPAPAASVDDLDERLEQELEAGLEPPEPEAPEPETPEPEARESEATTEWHAEPAPQAPSPADMLQSTTEDVQRGADSFSADAPADDLAGGPGADEWSRRIDLDEAGGYGGAPTPAEPPAAEPPPAPAAEPPPVSAAPPPLASPMPAPPARKSAAPARSAPPVDAAASTAPADATAFAPKKLRRGTPELVRIVVHQPKDLNEVIKAAKKIDPRTDPAPSAMPIGEVALGASIGVSLEVRGASCDGALQRRVWRGEPIDFSYSVEADPSVKQVVILARVFIDDAQIGVLAFTRNVSGPAKKPHSTGDRVRLKRHKRVFLSYSSKDRETVAQIATAYQIAGVEHFWDRASLKSGEEWHPRLRKEIDRADLFHLCWSRSASESEWVQKETEHALTRRKRHSGKPDITVQMLDGPPWAPHPPQLDAINFDDFVRAAIVGYARGDGSS